MLACTICNIAANSQLQLRVMLAEVSHGLSNWALDRDMRTCRFGLKLLKLVTNVILAMTGNNVMTCSNSFCNQLQTVMVFVCQNGEVIVGNCVATS